MKEIIEKIKDLVPSDNKISKIREQEVVILFEELRSKKCEMDEFVALLMNFPVSVTIAFFEENFVALKPEIGLFTTSLCSNEIFCKNINDSGLTRGFALLEFFLYKNYLSPTIAKTICKTVALAYKKGSFYPRAYQKFEERILKSERINPYQLFCLDFNNTQPDDLACLVRFVSGLAADGLIDISNEKAAKWITKYNIDIEEFVTNPVKSEKNCPQSQEKRKKTFNSSTNESELFVEKKTDEGCLEVPAQVTVLSESTLLKTIDDAESLVKEFTHSLSDTFGTITLLKEELVRKSEEIKSLQEKMEEKEELLQQTLTEKEEIFQRTLVEKDALLSALQEDSIGKDKQLQCLIEDKQDLEERVKNAYQMDEIVVNQQLLTLKSDISEDLQLEYEEYRESLGNLCNEDEFAAYRATIKRIFRTLKRHGIEFK